MKKAWKERVSGKQEERHRNIDETKGEKEKSQKEKFLEGG